MVELMIECRRPGSNHSVTTRDTATSIHHTSRGKFAPNTFPNTSLVAVLPQIAVISFSSIILAGQLRLQF